MSLSPEQRSLRASIGGHARAGKYDGREVTAAARAARQARYLVEYAIALEIQPYAVTVGVRREKNFKHPEVTGIWGGVTAAERASTRRMPTPGRLDALEAIHRQKMKELSLDPVGG